MRKRESWGVSNDGFYDTESSKYERVEVFLAQEIYGFGYTAEKELL